VQILFPIQTKEKSACSYRGVQSIKTRQQSRLEAARRELTENEQTDKAADEDAEFHRLAKIKTFDDVTQMLCQASSPDDDFRTAQQADKTLLTYWNRAKAGSSEFVINVKKMLFYNNV